MLYFAICGDNMCTTKLNAPFSFPGEPVVLCGSLQAAEHEGFVPLSQCLFLPAFCPMTVAAVKITHPAANGRENQNLLRTYATISWSHNLSRCLLLDIGSWSHLLSSTRFCWIICIILLTVRLLVLLEPRVPSFNLAPAQTVDA